MRGRQTMDENEWRQTVRDLYDELHFGPDNLFTGNRLARRLIGFIEYRHPGFFNEPHDAPPQQQGPTT